MIPTLAVVGHPNQGKSSIVSTLVHTDHIGISALSGTTLESTAYPLTINGATVLNLFDTPGFQRPRQLLDWLQNHAQSAEQRPGAVQTFLRQFSNQPELAPFHDEFELLRPLMAGAGIIYVVDGSVPYSKAYEAEMEVLRWTGRPRMALINPIGSEAYVEQWQRALGQYFSLVRVFNPMLGDVGKQQAIFRSFAELTEQWRQPLLTVAEQITQRQAQRVSEAALSAAETLRNMLSFQVSMPIIDTAVEKQTIEQSKRRYQQKLLAYEVQLQQVLAQIFGHAAIQINGDTVVDIMPDLFDRSSWYAMGLNRSKLISLAATAGSAAGVLIDVAVGGSSLMMGAVAGGLASAAATTWATLKPGQLRVKGVPISGEQVTFGPIKDLQFAFVLVGRLIILLEHLSERSHAQRNAYTIQHSDLSKRLGRALSQKQQISLTLLLRKGYKGWSNEEMLQMAGWLEEMLPASHAE